ncbi:HalOD1 output domain-containing protein [Natrinema salifodinae]|uniref:HalOD1 output domain-containing protein n=1 Tax=Natrinema salifodinae TaxID=1202768 RepID=UPI000A94D5E3
MSTALLVTVSAVLGVEPDDLEALSASVDLDALNDLFEYWRHDESAVEDGSVSFPYSVCAVTVHADGEIVIVPPGGSDQSTDG